MTRRLIIRAARRCGLVDARLERNRSRWLWLSASRSVSYGELNERANRLAHYLDRYRCHCGDECGDCVWSAGLDMIVGLLGIILKAGGTYVPLDPEYPLERLAFMLEESKVAILLSDENAGRRVTEFGRARRLCRCGAGRDLELLGGEPAQSLHAR